MCVVGSVDEISHRRARSAPSHAQACDPDGGAVAVPLRWRAPWTRERAHSAAHDRHVSHLPPYLDQRNSPLPLRRVPKAGSCFKQQGETQGIRLLALDVDVLGRPALSGW